MPVAFFGAKAQTRVSGNTGIGADAISPLAAVFTVMPLYVLARLSALIGGAERAWELAGKGRLFAGVVGFTAGFGG